MPLKIVFFLNQVEKIVLVDFIGIGVWALGLSNFARWERVCVARLLESDSRASVGERSL